MFTRKRIPALRLTEDWAKDGPRLTKWLNDYLLELEQKNALTISQAQIFADQGIQFPAAQVFSTDPNNLDDYEEGTWTPVLTFTTPGTLVVAYSVQDGKYTKFGQLVMLTFAIATSTFTLGTATGTLTITGAPFTASVSDGNYIAIGALAWQGITKASYTQAFAIMSSGASTVRVNASGSGQAIAAIASTDTPTGGTVVLRGSVPYII